jgi:SET domain-containing protein
MVQASPIQGVGRFAVDNISAGTIVLFIDGNIYQNENNSRTNHSLNNYNVDWDGEASWVANQDITAGEEIVMNYRQWVTMEVPDDHWLDRAH